MLRAILMFVSSRGSVLIKRIGIRSLPGALEPLDHALRERLRRQRDLASHASPCAAIRAATLRRLKCAARMSSLPSSSQSIGNRHRHAGAAAAANTPRRSSLPAGCAASRRRCGPCGSARRAWPRSVAESAAPRCSATRRENAAATSNGGPRCSGTTRCRPMPAAGLDQALQPKFLQQSAHQRRRIADGLPRQRGIGIEIERDSIGAVGSRHASSPTCAVPRRPSARVVEWSRANWQYEVRLVVRARDRDRRESRHVALEVALEEHAALCAGRTHHATMAASAGAATAPARSPRSSPRAAAW